MAIKVEEGDQLLAIREALARLGRLWRLLCPSASQSTPSASSLNVLSSSARRLCSACACWRVAPKAFRIATRFSVAAESVFMVKRFTQMAALSSNHGATIVNPDPNSMPSCAGRCADQLEAAMEAVRAGHSGT